MEKNATCNTNPAHEAASRIECRSRCSTSGSPPPSCRPLPNLQCVSPRCGAWGWRSSRRWDQQEARARVVAKRAIHHADKTRTAFRSGRRDYVGHVIRAPPICVVLTDSIRYERNVPHGQERLSISSADCEREVRVGCRRVPMRGGPQRWVGWV